MSYDLICVWLGLPTGVWPPDHYSLLGLKPGESDPTLIEERVHQRLDAVRRYQMTNPDPATEAMNRIAQAFVCLSEPASKRVYDAALLGTVAAEALAKTQPASQAADPLVLVYDPAQPNGPPVHRKFDAANQENAPPVRLQFDPANQENAPPVRVQYDPTTQATAPPIRRPTAPPVPEALPMAEVVEALPVAEAAEAVLPVAEAAEIVPEVVPAVPHHRGSPINREIYQQLVQTRRLIDQWNQVGQYLALPKRRLTRLGEINDLVRLLMEVREKLRAFPPLLGGVGQPGAMVLGLVQVTSVPMFQTLPQSQREALSLDWQTGQKVLEGHRDELRREVRALRKRSIFQRLGRATQTLVLEKPAYILIFIAVLAINVAILRSYVFVWIEHLVNPPSVVKSSDDKE